MNKPSLIGVIAGDRPLGGHRVSALLLLLPCLLIPTQQAIATTFEDSIRPILDNHCNDCHGMPDEGPEGDFSLAQYATRDSVLAAKRTWKMVLDVVEGHEMPPADAEDLADEEICSEVHQIAKQIKPHIDSGRHVDHQRSSWDLFFRSAVSYDEMRLSSLEAFGRGVRASLANSR